MEEDRSIKDTGSTFEGPEPTTIIKSGVSGVAVSRGSRSGMMIVGVVLVVSLLIAGLFLPPISLGERLGAGSETGVIGAEVSEDELAIRLQDSATDVGVSAVTAAELETNEATAAMAAALPGGSQFQSDVYLINYDDAAPTGSIAVAAPQGGSAQTVDLMGWDGSGWRFIALRETSDTQWVSAALPLPEAVALVESGAPSAVAVGAEVEPGQELPAAVLPPLTEVAAGTLTLGAEGALEGAVVSLAEGGYQQYVRATNIGIVVDQVSLASLLDSSTLTEQHTTALVEATAGYAGLNLDYQGVPPAQREAFTAFVSDLAEALQAADRQLVVTLATPMSTDSGQWDTGGQDWQAIGRIADAVYLQMPLNPAAYAEDGTAEELVRWAVTQIHRHKLSLLVTTKAIDGVGGTYRELPNSLALANFGELSLVAGSELVRPGAAVEVALAGNAGPLEWDGDTAMYRYVYEQAGQEHTVWLSNEAALSSHIRFAAPYRLRGVALRGLGNVADGAGYARAIDGFLNAAEPPEPDGAAIVWTVEDAESSVVASESGEALSFRWEGSDEPGRYTINAVFAQGEAIAELGSVSVEVEEPPAPTPTPEPEPTEEATEEPVVSEPEVTETPEAPVTAVDPGSDDAATNIAANFREGPGLAYRVIEVLPAGSKLSLLGRNAASDWYQVQVAGTEKQGWLFHNLLSINETVDTNALAVVEVDPPTVGDGDEPAPPPPPPIANTGFELGGQTHTLANPTLMHESGMTWVKFQHKWGPGDSPDAVAGRIGHAHGNGLKVLLSIPGAAAYPSSIDFAAYVEFLRGVAALGPDAIEIWNEMNIDFEWPAGQIDPNSYVNNMLKPAYEAIKSTNPNVMVISGAPAPTGFDNGNNAWADDRYMAGVAAAGGANYMDCIGVHHNAGATPPSASSGHPAGNNHYSWYFMPTLNMYYNAFGGSRPVCFTELGYLSGQDFGGVPSRFSWASGTTVSQHAQWLGEAVSLAGNSGRVRMVIVFNVDFTHWGDDPQAGFAMLRPDGSCPACNTLRAAMGQ